MPSTFVEFLFLGVAAFDDQWDEGKRLFCPYLFVALFEWVLYHTNIFLRKAGKKIMV